MRNSTKGSILAGLAGGLLLGYLVLSLIWGGSVVISFIIGAVLGAVVTYFLCPIIRKNNRS
jgi:uncharacterized membrane protein YeaQ/YmgE (transglycosylase-associated protein family)